MYNSLKVEVVTHIAHEQYNRTTTDDQQYQKWSYIHQLHHSLHHRWETSFKLSGKITTLQTISGNFLKFSVAGVRHEESIQLVLRLITLPKMKKVFESKTTFV